MGAPIFIYSIGQTAVGLPLFSCSLIGQQPVIFSADMELSTSVDGVIATCSLTSPVTATLIEDLMACLIPQLNHFPFSAQLVTGFGTYINLQVNDWRYEIGATVSLKITLHLDPLGDCIISSMSGWDTTDGGINGSFTDTEPFIPFYTCCDRAIPPLPRTRVNHR